MNCLTLRTVNMTCYKELTKFEATSLMLKIKLDSETNNENKKGKKQKML